MPASFDAVHIGARVVVRARLDPRSAAPHDGPSMTDAVGTLVSRTDATVVVATRQGEVTISRDRIVAAKEIPPHPSRRGSPHLAISMADLQRVMGPSWGALEREQLGDWELRASLGFTQRGNSVLPVGDPGVPLSSAVDAIEAWYAARTLPASVSLTGPVGFDPTHDPLGAELLTRGWSVGSRTLNLTAATERVAAGARGAPGALGAPGPEVHVSDELSPQWLAAYGQSRTLVPDATAGVLQGSPRQLFASIALGGGLAQTLELSTPGARDPRPVAIGRLGLARGWAGLGAVWTDPSFRGRGLGTRLTTHLAAKARQDGIHLMHLQVEAENATAIGLYERLGFEQHSSYVYLTQRPRG